MCELFGRIKRNASSEKRTKRSPLRRGLGVYKGTLVKTRLNKRFLKVVVAFNKIKLI